MEHYQPHALRCCFQGLMPKPNTELKFSLGTIARQHRMPTLECSGVRVSNVWKGHTVIGTAYVAF